MSRADTLKQKIERQIKYIFITSKSLAKKYPKDMVFDYIESLCHMIVLHHEPIYTINFGDEIETLKAIIKDKQNNEVIKSYYSCVVKTNEMIKEKYKNKIPNQLQSLIYRGKYSKDLMDKYMKKQGKIILQCPQYKLEKLKKDGYIEMREKDSLQLSKNTLKCVNAEIIAGIDFLSHENF